MGDRAGVDQVGIGACGPIGGDAAVTLELAGGLLGFGLIQFAAPASRSRPEAAVRKRRKMTRGLMPTYDTDSERSWRCSMVEIGLAILFVSILVAADRGRYDTLNEKDARLRRLARPPGRSAIAPSASGTFTSPSRTCAACAVLDAGAGFRGDHPHSAHSQTRGRPRFLDLAKLLLGGLGAMSSMQLRNLTTPYVRTNFLLNRTYVQDGQMASRTPGSSTGFIARGAQLPLMLESRPAARVSYPGPRRGSSACPRCAGPTASHGRRIVCVICGFGARPRKARRRVR